MPKKDVEWGGKCPRVILYQLVSCCLRCQTIAKTCRIWQPVPWNKTSAASLMSQHEICHTAFIVTASSAVCFTVFKTFHIFPLIFDPSNCGLWLDCKTKKHIKKTKIKSLWPLQRSSCSRCVWRFVCCQLRAVSQRTLQPRKVATSPSTPRSLSAASPAQRGLQAAQVLPDHLGPWVRWVCRG